MEMFGQGYRFLCICRSLDDFLLHQRKTGRLIDQSTNRPFFSFTAGKKLKKHTGSKNLMANVLLPIIAVLGFICLLLLWIKAIHQDPDDNQELEEINYNWSLGLVLSVFGLRCHLNQSILRCPRHDLCEAASFLTMVYGILVANFYVSRLKLPRRLKKGLIGLGYIVVSMDLVLNYLYY